MTAGTFEPRVQTGEPVRILIVEDDESMADNLSETLSSLGYATQIATTAEQALELLRGGSFGGVITDFKLPGRIFNKPIDLDRLLQRLRAVLEEG